MVLEGHVVFRIEVGLCLHARNLARWLHAAFLYDTLDGREAAPLLPEFKVLASAAPSATFVLSRRVSIAFNVLACASQSASLSQTKSCDA